MPTLSWIGKEKVVNHHLEVPYRVLEHRYGYRAENTDDKSFTGSGNMIIHGDNLEALKALLPEFEGKVKCIYIDPPYNTGNEGWVYNDNVNHPKIQKWLGEVVGKQDEDFTRHDKWLCMMYPRLRLLQRLLSEDGAIFISIDDNELANLKLLCDEVFGARNFIGQWHWYKSATPPNLSYKIKKNLEYVLVYEKERTSIKYKGVQKVSKSDDPIIKPQNTFKTLQFPPKSIHFKGLPDGIVKAGIYGTNTYPNKLLNDIEIEDGYNKDTAVFENRFIWVQSKLDEELSKGTRINCSKALVLSYKKSEYDPEVPPNLIDSSVGVDTTEEAGKLLEKLFGRKGVFEYPKSPSLVEYLISFLADSNSIILDSFAGSGTTAHAVLNLNKKDGGNRKFILVEMEDYADTITAERVRKVMSGYADTEGTGGCFDFYELGDTLFNADGTLNESVSEDRIREYVYYTETKQHLSRKRDDRNRYLLNTWNGVGYYLYYEPNQETAFTHNSLNIIGEKAERYIVYADTCTIDKDYLTDKNIIFRKIPRDIQKF